MQMQGDGIVSLLVCLSLLTGLVVGLRFNVRMLTLLCLATIVAGVGLGVFGYLSTGHGLLSTVVAVVALQVGYFVALVIGAMRLTEEPIGIERDVIAHAPRSEASRPTGA